MHSFHSACRLVQCTEDKKQYIAAEKRIRLRFHDAQRKLCLFVFIFQVMTCEHHVMDCTAI